MLSQLRLTWRLFRDPRVSPALKAIPLLGLAYAIWPVDLLPDVLPVLGQLDDLAVILLAINAFIQLCPPEVIEAVEREDSSISVRYRVEEDEPPAR
jgi:uncharacterized membrane protein YkvA (DUF1232 family)